MAEEEDWSMQLSRMTRVPLLLVSEFHHRGYERLRLWSGLRLNWSCSLGALCGIAPSDGSYTRPGRDQDLNPVKTVTYSSTQRDTYFGIEGGGLTIAELADAFAALYPELLEQSKGSDPAYVAWFDDMLRITDPYGVPNFSGEWDVPNDELPITSACGWVPEVKVPRPPRCVDLR
jgi:hypothetical protein